MKVRELMTGAPITVSPETPVFDARQTMIRERIRHLLVTEHHRLVGIVTDRDIRLCLPSPATSLSVGEVNYRLAQLPVTAVMSSPVTTVGPDDDAAGAARLLLNRGIGALPVVGSGRLLGILSRSDIILAFAAGHPAAAARDAGAAAVRD